MKNNYLVWKTTKDYYKSLLPNYGVISLLLIIEKLEVLEQYEECQKIFSAITDFNIEYRGDLKTRITKEYINEIKKKFNDFGAYPKNIMGHYEYYAKEILKDICEINAGRKVL